MEAARLGMVWRVLLALSWMACAQADGPMRTPSDAVRVRVRMVTVDLHATPVLLLEEDGGSRMLPIWIGTAEALSIAAHIEERTPPRPNTHDLAKRVIQGLHGEVVQALVNELREGTYFATLSIRVGREIVQIDARPSDAIAIALRTGAPILVRATLFEDAAIESGESGPEQAIRWIPRPEAQPRGTSPATPPLSL
jgi:bifunctional DNase/RNase